jgi:hypothetical protein
MTSRAVPGRVVRLRASRAPIEPKTHAAWLGAGGGAAFGSIVVGLIQAWITHKPLAAADISLIDTLCAAILALVSSYLAPHAVRPGDAQPLPAITGSGGILPVVTGGGGGGTP